MLTFLNKLRKSSIGYGSVRKYLLYAIGEILLVMIGILLALQVNNWNEFRKDRITEARIIEQLKENLVLNIEKLESQISRKQNSDFSSQVILSAIDNKQPYIDTLEAHFGWGLSIENPGPLSSAGYESFKNVGVEIIQNKALIQEIIYLFEDTYNKSQTRIERMDQLFVEMVRLRQKYLMRKSGFKFTPFDYDSLITDKYFYSWITSIRNSRGWAENALEVSLEETKKVLRSIEQEME